MNAEARYQTDKARKALEQAVEHTRRLYLGKHTAGYSQADRDDDTSKAHAAVMAALMNLEDLQRTTR